MDSLAAHAQAAVSGQNDQKGTFAVKVCPAASAPALAESRARMCTSQILYPRCGARLDRVARLRRSRHVGVRR